MEQSRESSKAIKGPDETAYRALPARTLRSTEYSSRWASKRQNLSPGFLTKRDSNQSPQLQRLDRKLKIACSKFRFYMILSNKRITKELISLRGCTCWYVPLIFVNTGDRFSRVEA